MHQDVFILGARGKVGRTVVKQIFEKGDCDKGVHTNPTRIVGLGGLGCFHFDENGISRELAGEFCSGKGNYQEMKNLDSLLDFVLERYGSSNGERGMIFADVTNAREEMCKFHLRVIRETPYGIVTANKHPLVSCSFGEFQELTREPARYGYKCSVMAGAEAVDKIKDLRDLGDLPIEISGCFSGTLGYVCTQLEEGRKLSEIVPEAQKLEYTEPHPADDLDGGDVERKIIILSRTAGFDVPREHVQRIPFIPEGYLAEKDIGKFLENLRRLDDSFSERVRQSNKNGMVLRYFAKFDNSGELPRISVGLSEVSRESPFGNLKGRTNKIVVRTKTYNEVPYCVEAPGAGLEITAQNIRRDLLHMLENRVLAKKKV